MDAAGLFICKVTIAQMLMFLFYHFFLRKETFFRLNRAYLLLSLLLPFLVAFPHTIHTTYLADPGFLFRMPDWQDVAGPGDKVSAGTGIVPFNLALAVKCLYLTIVTLLGLRILISMARIGVMLHRSPVIRKDNLRIVVNDAYAAPFSFFRWVFVDEQHLQSIPVLSHEKVHANQWHSLDLVAAELACALLWFNPFVFFHKQAIKANHEFLADQQVLQSGLDFEQYLAALTGMLSFSRVPGFASHFNQSLTLKRIHMMSTIKSRKRAFIKYFILMPLLLLLIVGFSKPAPAVQKLLPATANLQAAEVGIPSIAPYQLADKKMITRVSGYGKRINPITHAYGMHEAIDFAMPEGLDVLATAPGVVLTAGDEKKGFGKNLVISHSDGYKTKYAHLSEMLVKPGDKVTRGQVIGKVGQTGLSIGPHIHYEVLKGNQHLDPVKFIPKEDLPELAPEK